MSSPPDNTLSHPWDQLPGEPALWYGRFSLYRDLGPGRSITAASRAEHLARHKAPWPPNENWYRAAHTWAWRERALAWDAWHRELLSLSEYNIRLAARDRRIAVIEDALDLVIDGLNLAALPDMSQAEARKILPQLHRMLVDMLEAERKECAVSLAADRSPAPPITADDLRAAMRDLERQEQERQSELPPSTGPNRPAAGTLPAGSQDGRIASRTALNLAKDADDLPTLPRLKDTRLRLFICPALGDTSGPLDPDAMRQLGLRICRIFDASRTRFCEAFSRERTLRRPIELLHLDLRTTAEGIEFANGLTASGWRVRHSDNLRIVVLGRHAGPGLGPPGDARRPAWCAAVPDLIAVGEDMPPVAARTFAQNFWPAIARGQPPAAALAEALSALEPAMRDYVTAHLVEPAP